METFKKPELPPWVKPIKKNLRKQRTVAAHVFSKPDPRDGLFVRIHVEGKKNDKKREKRKRKEEEKKRKEMEERGESSTPEPEPPAEEVPEEIIVPTCPVCLREWRPTLAELLGEEPGERQIRTCDPELEGGDQEAAGSSSDSGEPTDAETRDVAVGDAVMDHPGDLAQEEEEEDTIEGYEKAHFSGLSREEENEERDDVLSLYAGSPGESHMEVEDNASSPEVHTAQEIVTDGVTSEQSQDPSLLQDERLLWSPDFYSSWDVAFTECKKLADREIILRAAGKWDIRKGAIP